MKKITLLLIADNSVMREGALSLLRILKYYVLGIDSSDRNDILLKIAVFKPDAVLLDLGLRKHNSLRLVKLLKKEFADIRIIIMNFVPMPAGIPEYVKSGVNGFIRNDASLNDFESTIHAVVQGSNVFPRLLVNSLFSQIVENELNKKSARFIESVKMTRREKEIIKLLSEGLDNREICNRINSSIQSVINEIQSIMEKLALYMCLESAGKGSENHK